MITSNIPTITESVKSDYQSGKMTLKQCANILYIANVIKSSAENEALTVMNCNINQAQASERVSLGSQTARARRSNNGRGSIVAGKDALGEDQLRKVCPSIFADRPDSMRSDKYKYVSTSNILDGLKSEGFEPYSASQAGARTESKQSFTKHMVRLRHRDEMMRAMAIDDTINEIVLINSHDGSSAFNLMAGSFRLVCSNGLVIPDKVVGDVKVTHKGNNVSGDVIDGCISILGNLEKSTQSRELMRGIELSTMDKLNFAEEALKLKYTNDDAPYDFRHLLAPRRAEDNKSSLWHVFNVVQENLIKGGIRYNTTNHRGRLSRRTSREVRSIQMNTSLNRNLYDLAVNVALAS